MGDEDDAGASQQVMQGGALNLRLQQSIKDPNLGLIGNVNEQYSPVRLRELLRLTHFLGCDIRLPIDYSQRCVRVQACLQRQDYQVCIAEISVHSRCATACAVILPASSLVISCD